MTVHTLKNKDMLRTFFLFLILMIITVSSGSYWLYKNHLTMPLPLNEMLYYTVPSGTTLQNIATDLEAQALLNFPTATAWVWYARYQKKAHLIKTGKYLIPVGTTPQQLLDILIAGKSIAYKLTLLEGWNFRQMMAAIHEHPKIVHTLTDNAHIMEKLGKGRQHPEGRFFPDTYHFPEGTTDVEFLQRAYHLMTLKLEEAWQHRQADLPLKTAYDALILASIIEKETGKFDEYPIVSGVFIRRLRKNMLLQTDPTVIYSLGEKFDGNIRKKDLRSTHPYNTYKHKGLPPTPIAMPGQAALYAAVHPAQGKSLFFVGKGNGRHYFSETYQEHKCAVSVYQLKKTTSPRCQKYDLP